ncbi:SERTA domain-containing protein 3 [Marasmius crinis-equi]|uniref:SERTA domain-containing protein 3 n=1 Tax=Marasmius crinis-equi TaxID=585013 RepID=A0ABR3F710_9AGAR
MNRKAGKSQLQAVASKRRQTFTTRASEQKRKHEVEADSEASSKRARVEETSENSSIGPDTFPELPEGVSEDPKFYARQALALFQREEAKDLKGWKSLVHSWFEHERRGDFEGTNSRGRLGMQGRPKWVGSWVARARNPEYRSKDPEDYKASKFLTEWWAWWGSLQPKWRAFDQAKRPRASSEYTEGSWDTIRVSGPNGLTSAVAPLVHAASVLAGSPSGGTGRDKKALEQVQVDLEGAVDDVAYILGRLLATSNS